MQHSELESKRKKEEAKDREWRKISTQMVKTVDTSEQIVTRSGRSGKRKRDVKARWKGVEEDNKEDELSSSDDEGNDLKAIAMA